MDGIVDAARVVAAALAGVIQLASGAVPEAGAEGNSSTSLSSSSADCSSGSASKPPSGSSSKVIRSGKGSALVDDNASGVPANDASVGAVHALASTWSLAGAG